MYFKHLNKFIFNFPVNKSTSRLICKYSTVHCEILANKVVIAEKEFEKDHMTNVTPKILSYIGKNLHLQKTNPLNHLRKRIVEVMGNPLFSVYDQLLPVVNLNQNFDSLLVPKNHVSRQKSDNYYINQNYLLRAHTTAHQTELIQMGLDNFLVVGDVFRRDSIDSSHYPVFHQVDAVRLCSKHDV
ncbi:putative phenylalanine--tRNA ligase, mitochondrial, partial [Armadillidium nasatum]